MACLLAETHRTRGNYCRTSVLQDIPRCTTMTWSSPGTGTPFMFLCTKVGYEKPQNLSFKINLVVRVNQISFFALV